MPGLIPLETVSKEFPNQETPRFPYGTKINLDKDVIDKLEIAMPEIGDKMALKAIVEVVDLSKGEDEINMGLQITEMKLVPTGEETDPGEALYGVPRDKTKEGPPTFVGNP
jgi:hypothetical protein